jgi:hypothetical protein
MRRVGAGSYGWQARGTRDLCGRGGVTDDGGGAGRVYEAASALTGRAHRW